MAHQPGVPSLRTLLKAPAEYTHVHCISFFAPALLAFEIKLRALVQKKSLTCSKGKEQKLSFTSIHKSCEGNKYRLHSPSHAYVLQNEKLNARVSPIQLKMVTFAISVNSSPPTLEIS